MALHEVQLKGYSVRPGNLSLGTFDSYGIEQLHVTLDDTWSGLAVTATFNPPDGEPVEIRVPENGLIDVPAEATANEGTGTIVYCGVASGAQRISKTQGYNVITHGNVGTTVPFNPSESLATQVLQAALSAEQSSAEAKSVADGLRSDAANGKFNGKDGAKGDKGNTGPQGPRGEKGNTGAKGADGVSPTVQVETIDGGHRVTFTDASDSHAVDVLDGKPGKDAVVDATLTQDGQAADAKKTGEAISQLKEDTAKLKDGKISKFYASSQGNTNLSDSDHGRIVDLMLYGKSSQDGTPTPDNPVEIRSVVNPVVKVMGKNLFSCCDYQKLEVKGNDKAKNITVTEKELSFTSDASTEHCGVYISGSNLQGYIQGYNPKTKYFISIKVKSSVSCNVMWGADSIARLEIPAGKTTLKISTLITKNFVVLYVANAESNITVSDILISTIDTDYEPYTETVATLPYTLNAIPVSSGGNVTIDGQQYIADYVDVERGKLVRMVAKADVSDLTKYNESSIGTNTRYLFKLDVVGFGPDTPCMCKKLKYLKSYSSDTPHMYTETDRIYIFTTDTSFANDDYVVFYPIAIPTETDLTADEIAAFKALASYYPVTNVSTTSDQLDGYTVFDYPISLANGWNYVKQQLGDTRDYLYGIDLMTAEAYVNSEYAAALAEIEA